MRDFLSSLFVFLFRNRLNRTHPKNSARRSIWQIVLSLFSFQTYGIVWPQRYPKFFPLCKQKTVLINRDGKKQQCQSMDGDFRRISPVNLQKDETGPRPSTVITACCKPPLLGCTIQIVRGFHTRLSMVFSNKCAKLGKIV